MNYKRLYSIPILTKKLVLILFFKKYFYCYISVRFTLIKVKIKKRRNTDMDILETIDLKKYYGKESSLVKAWME